MSDDRSLVGKVVVIAIVWGIALLEPTPLGEAGATILTLGVLGLDESKAKQG